MSEDSLRRGSEDSFVVHRGKNIPTLSSVIQDDGSSTRLRMNKEKLVDGQAAGKPSNWEENRKSSYAGRRSRRNSMTDDSQLTIENFGGSQDNINFIGRNPDKEVSLTTLMAKDYANKAYYIRNMSILTGQLDWR